MTTAVLPEATTPEKAPSVPERYLKPRDSIFYYQVVRPEPPVPVRGAIVSADSAAAHKPAGAETFARLAAEWKADAGTIASFPKQFMHPAYQNIVGLGPAAITPILRELELNPDYWFHALRAITRVDPVKPEDRGNLRAMSAAWLAWGRSEGYL